MDGFVDVVDGFGFGWLSALNDGGGEFWGFTFFFTLQKQNIKNKNSLELLKCNTID